MNILEVLAAPDLFGPSFRGDTWRAWQAFLASLFALDMDDDVAALYRAHTGRTTPPSVPFMEAALIVGRRGGKSRVLASIATFLATFRDYEPYLAPGEMATVAVLASDRRQARSIMRYVSGLLAAVPMLKTMMADENNEAITLTNRVVIEVSTASFRSTRGYSFAAVLCDEVAFWRSDEASANPDTEILRALRPGMANIPGSILLLASSPYAKRGELYATFRRHYGKDDARVLVWRADTATMNPRIDPAIIAEAYESDPEAARAEYGAEFRDDLADFVTREIVDVVTMWGRAELPPEPGVTYSAFCDPSGGANDAMTLAIGHLSSDGVAVLDAIREVRPPFSPEEVVADFAALLRTYGLSRVVGDRYGGEWPRQRFREHGISYEPSARPKSDIYVDLLPLLNARRVELLESPRLSAQLVSLERRTARSGRDSVDHSPGGHDDLVNAAAGVLVQLDLDRRPAMVRVAALTVNGAPHPLPTTCMCHFAVMAMGKDGTAATIYAARTLTGDVPLLLTDFAVAPLDGMTLGAVASRLRDLTAECRPFYGTLGAFLPAEMHQQARLAGLLPHDVTEAMEDAEALALAVAVHVGAGKVKITDLLSEKAKSSPFAAALDFRPGDKVDTPLRVAALQAIALALNGEAVMAA